MQDRFRFRTWYTDYDGTQEMLYDTQATYDFMRGTYHHGDFQEVLDDKNCINMQCTGRKDKNGKLIFEGDIVKFRNIDNKYYIGTIKYTDEDALFCLSYKNENNRDDWDYVSKYRLEVIGNIYENPELLGKGK